MGDLVKIPANKLVSLKHLLYLEILINQLRGIFNCSEGTDPFLWLLLRLMKSKPHHVCHLKHLMLFLMGITLSNTQNISSLSLTQKQRGGECYMQWVGLTVFKECQHCV